MVEDGVEGSCVMGGTDSPNLVDLVCLLVENLVNEVDEVDRCHIR